MKYEVHEGGHANNEGAPPAQMEGNEVMFDSFFSRRSRATHSHETFLEKDIYDLPRTLSELIFPDVIDQTYENAWDLAGGGGGGGIMGLERKSRIAWSDVYKARSFIKPVDLDERHQFV